MENNKFFSGDFLIGDDFSQAEIEAWFEDEKEGYANLSQQNKPVDTQPSYSYHTMNKVHGFSKLPAKKNFDNVLGIGAAFGLEFLPIASRIKNLHILEPSDQLVSKEIAGLTPIYTKPEIMGDISYEDNTFDLITCFGVLHHIPNVSHVFKEIHRILASGGYLLLREPINSMGDWNNPRTGLTKRERGIPPHFMSKLIKELDFEVVNAAPCFCMTAFLSRTIGKKLKKPLFQYKSYVVIDKYLSKLFRWNFTYHPTKFYQRIAPQSTFYVLKKK